MKTFEITFTTNGIFSVNLVKAKNPEQATEYFKTLLECKGTIIGCSEFFGSPKPGQPVHTCIADI